MEEIPQCTIKLKLVSWEMDKNILNLIIHYMKKVRNIAAGKIPPSLLSSLKCRKLVQFEQHLLCGIFESTGNDNGPLEQGSFLFLIAATCVVGKSPLPAPL